MIELIFCYYDFELTVPKEWVVAFDRKSNYNAGIVYFTTPTNGRLDHVWDKLDKYTKKHPNIDAFMKSYFDVLRNNRNIKELNMTEGQKTTDDNHELFPHEISYTLKTPLSKALKQKLIGNTLYCKKTNRFVAVYTSLNTNKENPDEASLREAIKSFICNCNLPPKP